LIHYFPTVLVVLWRNILVSFTHYEIKTKVELSCI